MSVSGIFEDVNPYGGLTMATNVEPKINAWLSSEP